MAYVMALDQGTTSSRAIVFDGDGRRVAMAQREFRQIYPRPGWVEHDAVEIWQSQLEVARRALAAAGLTARDLVAVGITNQRETTVLWERASGRPVAHAIVWQDRRTAPLCERLRGSDRAGEIRRRTGLELDPYFSATKVNWLLANVPGARERAQAGELAFGTIDSWLAYKLTGRHVTDASNASRTLLFDLQTGSWSEALCDAFEIPAALLPEIVDSSGVCGEIEADLLGAPVPLAGLAGDQQAALFGQLCVQPGAAKNTYGTGCFLLLNTGAEPVRSSHGLLTTVAWRIAGRLTYALEGSVFIGGAAVQWLRDELGLIEHAADVERLAASVEDSGGVVCVPAFAGLGAPHWDPHARGLVIGITRGTSAAHLARATLDGIAHQVADVVEAMRQDAGMALGELRVDGGASANDLLLQLQADLLRTDVVRPRDVETTARGAAYLAGLGVGLWSDAGELADRFEVDRRFRPTLVAERAAAARARWHRAVRLARGWAGPESEAPR